MRREYRAQRDAEPAEIASPFVHDPHALDFVCQQHKIRLCPAPPRVTGVRGLQLARFFPAVAVSVFGAVALVLVALDLRSLGGIYDPRPVIAACVAFALGHAVRLGQVLLRQR